MENNKKIGELIKKLETSNYLEILDKSILGDIENDFNNYLENYKRLESEDKILTIGIVGQVKVGKSSFLNTLFFESEDILPKAATPMTAALTKIKYSENISAKVHFFTSSDFETVENGARECESAIENERKKINEDNKKKGKPESKLTDAQLLGMVELSDSNKAFYEIFENFKKNEGELRGKLENSANSENNDNFEILDNVESIEALKNRLEDYVGVNGKYMPIVKYIEIFLNIEAIKDFDIVDTPGLNDPVISRGQLTRDFLGKCDVIFLLSYSQQFLDSQDISLFSEQLPQEGIKEVKVIGSKFDSGLIGESQKYNGDIKVAQEGIKFKLNNEFKDKIKKDIKRENIKEIFERAFPPLYISSSCYDIYKHYGKLSKNEELIKNNIIRAFPHFLDDAESYKKLSGIEIFNSAIIPEIVSKKEIILKERFNDIYYGFIDKLIKYIDELYQEVKRKQKELENKDIKSIEDKLKDINDTLKKLGNNIKDCFNKVKNENVKNGFNDLKMNFVDMIEQIKANENTNEKLKLETNKRFDKIARFFGDLFNTNWGYEIVPATLIQDIIDKIRETIKNCQKELNDTCKNIFNINYFRDTLSDEIKNALSKQLGENDFDVENITLPLNRVLRDMLYSPVELKMDYTNFILEEVHNKEKVPLSEMKNLISTKIIPEILGNIKEDLTRQTDEIIKKLDEQENNLISDISSSIEKDAEELKNQLKDKKKYEEMYKEAVSGIEEVKNNI